MFSMRPRPNRQSSLRDQRINPGARHFNDDVDPFPLTEKAKYTTSDDEATEDLHFGLQSTFSTRHNTALLPTAASTSDQSCPLRRAMQLSGVLEELPSRVDDNEPINTPHSLLSFHRRAVPSIPSQHPDSGLTTLLNSPSPPIVNPFSNLIFPLPSGEDLMDIRVYCPHAEDPVGKPLELKVEREADVERLMLIALWTYWEKAWLPPLSVNHTDDATLPTRRKHRSIKASKAKLRRVISPWSLRIVRDGFLDYATEAPDPSDSVEALESEEYALIKLDSASAGPFNGNAILSSSPPTDESTNYLGSTFQTLSSAESSKDPQTLLGRRHSSPAPFSIKKRLSHVRDLSLPFQRASTTDSSSTWLSSSVYDTFRIRVFTILSMDIDSEQNSSEQPQRMSVAISKNSTIKELLDTVCREKGIKHPEKFSLAALDVRKVYQGVPLEWNVSKFETNTEFVLAKKL